MRKTAIYYALVLALTTFFLQWLDYKYSARAFTTELYIGLVALGFTAFGVWLGVRLSAKGNISDQAVNSQAIAALGISDRELEVLGLLVSGQSNKEIAANLFVSPNTVKTHVSRLYEKLDVSRRTQAVRKAKTLKLVT